MFARDGVYAQPPGQHAGATFEQTGQDKYDVTIPRRDVKVVNVTPADNCARCLTPVRDNPNYGTFHQLLLLSGPRGMPVASKSTDASLQLLRMFRRIGKVTRMDEQFNVLAGVVKIVLGKLHLVQEATEACKQAVAASTIGDDQKAAFAPFAD